MFRIHTDPERIPDAANALKQHMLALEAVSLCAGHSLVKTTLSRCSALHTRACTFCSVTVVLNLLLKKPASNPKAFAFAFGFPNFKVFESGKLSFEL